LKKLINIKISYLWKDIPEYILFDYRFIKSYNDHRLQRKTNNITPNSQNFGTLNYFYLSVSKFCEFGVMLMMKFICGDFTPLHI